MLSLHSLLQPSCHKCVLLEIDFSHHVERKYELGQFSELFLKQRIDRLLRRTLISVVIVMVDVYHEAIIHGRHSDAQKLPDENSTLWCLALEVVNSGGGDKHVAGLELISLVYLLERDRSFDFFWISECTYLQDR